MTFRSVTHPQIAMSLARLTSKFYFNKLPLRYYILIDISYYILIDISMISILLSHVCAV
jgi:hypothetical protein